MTRIAASPLSGTGPQPPFSDLAVLDPLIRDAVVAGVSRTAHGAHEFTVLSHRILRFLVERHGFRCLAVELDAGTGRDIDTWLQTGSGSLTNRLKSTFPWWRSAEFQAVLTWMREFTARRPDDPLRFLGVNPDGEPDMNTAERHFADVISDWHGRTGHRIVYWSGSHSAAGHDRLMRWRTGLDGVRGRNAGGHLRAEFGAGYTSLGLTFGRGSVRWNGTAVGVPPAPDGFTEHLLADVSHPSFVVDLHAAENRAFASELLRLRPIGPGYDPRQPASFSGGRVGAFFDALLHVQSVTPAAERHH